MLIEKCVSCDYKKETPNEDEDTQEEKVCPKCGQNIVIVKSNFK